MAMWEDPETGRLGIGTSRLARESGVPHGSVSNFLRGKTEPRPNSLRALADFFEVHFIVASYIAYSMTSTDPEHLDKLTELGRELYPLPPGVVNRFMLSQQVQIEANEVLSKAGEKDQITSK
jgi:transcriptional regulator with XRE-family HTH domain